MIQDLNGLSVLGKNPAPLTAVSYNLTGLDIAANTPDDMAFLLAKANGDKAFHYMKELTGEIRAAGKYLFRKDKNRYKGTPINTGKTQQEKVNQRH